MFQVEKLIIHEGYDNSKGSFDHDIGRISSNPLCLQFIDHEFDREKHFYIKKLLSSSSAEVEGARAVCKGDQVGQDCLSATTWTETPVWDTM